ETACAVCAEGIFTRAKAHGWCRTHGVYDCPFEHPEVIQLGIRPPITPADLALAGRALAFTPRPENSSRCKLHPTIVQVAAQKVIDKLGIKFEPVWTGAVEEVVTANAEVAYNQERIAALGSVVSGRIWSVEKKVGAAVREGGVLALVDAAAVGQAKAAFLRD